MKILVTGSKGQLGGELVLQAKNYSLEAIPYDLPEIDITSEQSINEVFYQDEFSLLINAAAYTQVDKAESEEDIVYAVNGKAPGLLAKKCFEKNIPVIHISTDFVFNGESDFPYMPDDKVDPLSVYGKSKAMGEDEARRNNPEHIIVRTAWLYGISGNNFVKTMLRLGRERDSLGVVGDQKGSPTLAEDLAEAILITADGIVNRGVKAWGTYHYTGAGVTTWHGFASAVFARGQKYFDFSSLEVKSLTTQEYPTPATRPKYSVLDCESYEKKFNVSIKPWEERLDYSLPLIVKNITGHDK